MQRWLNLAVWLFFAATVYLILVEAVWPWVHLPDLGNIGFTLVFVLFAILHCAVFEGWRRTGVFFLISALVSYTMEEVGVRTGAIYGPYHYSDMLGAKLGHVPILIPLAWFMMIYPSWMVARCIVAQRIITRKRPDSGHSLAGITALAVVAAFVMTAWDTVMDPGMAAAGNWVWEQGGPYFGVPLRNYFGWMLTTFFVYWSAGFAWRGVKRTGSATPGLEAQPVIVYAFFALRYVMAGSIPALQLVALFSMGLPALLALMQIATKKNEESGEA